MKRSEHLNDKLQGLPNHPGVYLMKDQGGTILYVGKANSLKSRVRSYFSSNTNQQPIKTQKLVSLIVDFEVMLVTTEVEALLLERTLIKHHQPPYNVLLRDDKEYPYLKFDLKQDWPRLEKVRKQEPDGGIYIGPFGYGRDLRSLLELTRDIFPLVQCSEYEFKHAKKPCHFYHMKKCLAPCTKEIEKDFYRGIIQDATQFLEGKNTQVLRMLKEKMKQASKDELFERAGLFRDQIKALENLYLKQSVVIPSIADADFVGLSQVDEQASISVLLVRNGKLLAQDKLIVDAKLQNPEEILEGFFLQYYEQRKAPPIIIIPFEFTNMAAVKEVIGKVKFKTPRLREHKILMENAQKNAEFSMEEFQRQEIQKQTVLEVVQERLGLKNKPVRAECMDISNLGGEAIVASNVCFINGKPSKKDYRIMHIRSVTGSPDDYTSMYEAMKRRLNRIDEVGMFDLMIIDGGKGQLGAALRACKEYGPQNRFDIVSLAKSHVLNEGEKVDEVIRSYERIYFPHEEAPYILKAGTAEFRFFTQLRDEAHRFALKHHRIKRSKLKTVSALDALSGLGPILKTRLYETFGDIEGIKKATMEELQSINGVSKKLAQVIFDWGQGS